MPKHAHKSDWLGVAASNDGRLWTGGQDQFIQEWSPETGNVLHRENVKFPVDQLAVSADGQRVLGISGMQKTGRKATVHLFDRTQQRVLWEKTSEFPPASPQFASNDALVFWQESSRVLAVETLSGKVVREFSAPKSTYVTAYAMTTDGLKCAIAFVSFDRKTPPSIILIDIGNPENKIVVQPFQERQPAAKIKAVSFSPDDQALAVAGGCEYLRGDVVVLDATTGKTLSTSLETKVEFRAIKWISRENEFNLMDGGGGLHHAKFTNEGWNTRSIHQVGGHPLSFSFSPSGQTWAMSGLKTTIWGSGNQSRTLRHASPENFDPALFLAMAFLFVMFVLILTPIVLITASRTKARSKRLQEVARRLEFTFSPQTTQRMFDRFRGCSLFHRGWKRWLHDILQGNLNGHETIGGVLTVETRTGRNTTFSNQLLILFPDSGHRLPAFTLEPENWVTRIADAMTGTDINFDHSQLATDFSRQFRLKSPDPESVRRLFDGSLLELFVNSKGWMVRNDGGHLCFERSYHLQSWKLFFTADVFLVDVDFMAGSWQAAADMVTKLQSLTAN